MASPRCVNCHFLVSKIDTWINSASRCSRREANGLIERVRANFDLNYFRSAKLDCSDERPRADQRPRSCRFRISLAQILTIILTFRRERDVEDLRELVEEQRIRHAELRAWLAGRSASRSSRIASEGKPAPEWTATVKVSESGMPLLETKPGRSEDDPVGAARALEWQRDAAARLRSSLQSQIPTTEQATPTSPTVFKWFKDDPPEPPEIAEARSMVAGQPQAPDQDSLESKTTRSIGELDEVERTLKAIKSLKGG
jgi:hypothetical protein